MLNSREIHVLNAHLFFFGLSLVNGKLHNLNTQVTRKIVYRFVGGAMFVSWWCRLNK